MSGRQGKKYRRFMRETFSEKVGDDANRYLRAEVHRLARIRDILGVSLIVAAVAVIILSAMLINSLV